MCATYGCKPDNYNKFIFYRNQNISANNQVFRMVGEQFPHVLRSLAPHTVLPGLLAEVDLEGSLWPVQVKAVCGPLLEVRPLGRLETRWYDSRRGVWPWGEARNRGVGLTPPSSISAKEEGSDWYQALEAEATPLPPLLSPLLPGAGHCPSESLRPGSRLELRSEGDPGVFWVVTVTDTTGGFIGLSYDSPELKPQRDFRLFYLSSRLHPCGTVAEGQGGKFGVPACLRARGYPEQVWRVVTQSFKDVPEDKRAPAWCFPPELRPVPHGFQERMLLTVIDPKMKNRFRVAIVERVMGRLFAASLLEAPEELVVCGGNSQEILPISWAIEQGLLSKASLQTMSCSPLSRIAPRNLFMALAKPTAGFKPGDKMEYCTSADTLEFVRAVVREVRGHILELSVESREEKLLTTDGSMDIFPEGWCDSNGIKLAGDPEDTAEDMETDENTHNAPDPQVALPNPTLSFPDSSWSPPIYFNHLCYSASFLSRHRLESLPRFIGSGPVRLVMRNVLSRLIGSSFKSGAVLKKLERNPKRPRPNFSVETMKGKSRVLQLQSEIELPALASQVTAFCREVCQKLSCCPYLFGPQLVGEECPSACNSRPKSDFHAVEGDGRARRGTKRGRRRGRGAGEGTATPGAVVGSGQSSSCSSPSGSPTPSAPVTTCPTRESSPNSRNLVSAPSSTEVEHLQKILAERCQEQEEEEDEDSPPPRPPSPKLLRSKSSLLPRPQTEQTTPRAMEQAKRTCEGLEPAFQVDFSVECPVLLEPPPIRRVVLPSNPIHWSPEEVAQHLARQEDVAKLAPLFLQDEVDGQALLLLNLPSLLEHWNLRLGEGVLLAKHIESIKLAFYAQYAFKGAETEPGGRRGIAVE